MISTNTLFGFVYGKNDHDEEICFKVSMIISQKELEKIIKSPLLAEHYICEENTFFADMEIEYVELISHYGISIIKITAGKISEIDKYDAVIIDNVERPIFIINRHKSGE